MNLGQENEYQEFKTSLAQLDKGLKSLTAMLNRHGRGCVFFGVDDHGEVIGLDVGKNTLLEIRNKISLLIDPKVINNIELLKDNEKDYIKITAQGSDIPYSFDGRYYWRNVSSDEQASNDLLRKMLVAGDKDIIRQIPSENQNLTFVGLCNAINSQGQHAQDSAQFRQSYGLINNEGQLNMMAFLLSDQNTFEIKFVEFEGRNKAVLSHRTVYTDQSLIESTMAVLNKVKPLNSKSINVTEGIRREIDLFSYEAFREAWINAVVHNSWQEKIPPAVYLYDDRIEIVSYGGLPYGLSQEAFYSGTSLPVNRALLTVFIANRLSEQTGHGNPFIVSNYGREAFELGNGMVKVTLRFAFKPLHVMLRQADETLTETQRSLLGFLKSNPNSKLADVASEFGITLIGVKKAVAKLQAMGLIKREGSKRFGKWVVQFPNSKN